MRFTEAEVLAILAPFVTPADIKARNLREAAKNDGRSGSRVHHYAWGTERDLAREMGVQARSICGKKWIWPLRADGTADPGWGRVQGRPCKSCLRIYHAAKNRRAD